MRTDDLNEWQRFEDDETEQMLEPSMERRGGQIIFQFPEKRSLDLQISKALSPVKSNHDTTPTQRWSMASREELFSRQLRTSNEIMKQNKGYETSREDRATTTQRVRVKPLNTQSLHSPTHINQLILQLQDPYSNESPRPSHSSSTHIRIRKPSFNYQSLKMKL